MKRKMLELGYTMSSDNRKGEHLDGQQDVPFVRAYRVFQNRWHVDPAKKPFDKTDPLDSVTATRIIEGITEILK